MHNGNVVFNNIKNSVNRLILRFENTFGFATFSLSNRICFLSLIVFSSKHTKISLSVNVLTLTGAIFSVNHLLAISKLTFFALIFLSCFIPFSLLMIGYSMGGNLGLCIWLIGLISSILSLYQMSEDDIYIDIQDSNIQEPYKLSLIDFVDCNLYFIAMLIAFYFSMQQNIDHYKFIYSKFYNPI